MHGENAERAQHGIGNVAHAGLYGQERLGNHSIGQLRGQFAVTAFVAGQALCCCSHHSGPFRRVVAILSAHLSDSISTV